jgi:hypothetical protein
VVAYQATHKMLCSVHGVPPGAPMGPVSSLGAELLPGSSWGLTGPDEVTGSTVTSAGDRDRKRLKGGCTRRAGTPIAAGAPGTPGGSNMPRSADPAPMVSPFP